MSYESERRPGRYMPLLVGYLVGNLIGSVIANAMHEDPESRVRNVQINNEQMYEQLRPAHTLGGLILNDSDHTFTFNSQGTDGTPETCTGKYEVQHNQAHVIGDLACTQTVTAVPTN